jgi:hypothetical protein
MNSETHFVNEEDLRLDYDFSQGVRGKHYKSYRAGTNVAFLDPDVASVFTDSASVNQALRLLVRLAETAVPGTRQKPDSAPTTSRGRKGSRPTPGKATLRTRRAKPG